MKKQFFPAPEVAVVGRCLIDRYHRHLLEHQVRVEFIFCSETPSRNGKAIWGQARKISSVNAFLRHEKEVDWEPGLSDEEIAAIQNEDERELAEVEAKIARDNAREAGNAPFFLITISKPIWDGLDEKGRQALVDHELMHCGACYDSEGKTKLVLIPHDFEGFNDEIKRYGLWRRDAEELADAIKNGQLYLVFEKPELVAAQNEDEQ